MAGRGRIVLRKGLDLTIPGAPRPLVEDARERGSVALLGLDHPAVRTALRVAEGDRVLLGQTLFVDRRHPEIRFTSPAAGVVRTARPEEGARACLVVVETDRSEDRQDLSFEACELEEVLRLERAELVRRLLEAGEWPSLRERPVDRIPTPDSTPDAVFVCVMDSNPHAAALDAVLADREEDLRMGIAALSRLGDGPTFVCCAPGIDPAVADLPGVHRVCFEGPHPAGLVGTHIHHLFPIREGRRVWHVGAQDTLGIGRLLRSAQVDPDRVISLAGPQVRDPRLIRTRLGSSTDQLVRGELLPGGCRVVSGSLLSGRAAARPEAYLGRYHQQITVVSEAHEPRDRPGRSWLVPFLRRGRPVPGWRRPMHWSTERHGTTTAMLPLGVFDAVVPMRIPIALLLRALAAGDLEAARRLGALELAEEDLALCTFLCPAKLEYGELLRSALDGFDPGAA